jgi:hypothetical protein
MLKRIVGVGLVGAFAIACGSSSSRSGFEDPANGGAGGGSSGDQGPIGGQQAGENPKADECQKMDIVFVVDDSGSMKEEQSNLASNFPKFVNVLEQFKTKSGAKLDWRVAVTTTGRDVSYTMATPLGSFPMSEKGDNGAFRNTKSCGTSARWVPETDANASSEFSCLAQVGTGGPSIEMPLYSLKLAFNDRMTDGTNKGFLRDDALLALVIMTDEDDCSREDDNFTIQSDSCETMPNLRPISEYAAMFDDVAHGPGRWAAAVIAGDKACTSSFGDAIEAKRLKQLVSIAGKNGTFSSICNGDLTTALDDALKTFDAACKSFPPVR